LAFAKESQWFWAIPNAPRFFKVRFENSKAEDFWREIFLEGRS